MRPHRFDVLKEIFHESWSSARREFINVIGAAGGTYEEIPVDGVAPDGQPLSIGVGILSFADGNVVERLKEGTSEKIVIHTSGVHGVEGFAGSAGQILWLRDLIAAGRAISAKGRFTIVFVHAVNPWGMSWLRRVNGQNVDLNRNALRPEDKRPDASPYLAVRDVLMARGGLGRLWLARIAGLALRKGVLWVTQALTGGQYVDPAGLYYGGDEWQPELVALRNYITRNFAQASDVVAVDVHTGLGPFGFESVFVPETADIEDVRRLSRALDRDITADQLNGEATYRISGAFAYVIESALPRARVRNLLQEFGVRSSRA